MAQSISYYIVFEEKQLVLECIKNLQIPGYEDQEKTETYPVSLANVVYKILSPFWCKYFYLEFRENTYF